MFILRIWSFIRGYLLISISRSRTERLLNMAVMNGLRFWDLEYRGDKAYIKIRVEDFKRLRSIVSKTGCRVKVEYKVGLPFYIKKLRRRTGLIMGAFLFVAVLYFFSSFIWFIEITGYEAIPSNEIQSILEEQGIKIGILKSYVDVQELEKQLVVRHPDIIWAGISIQGTHMKIDIVERITKPDIDNEPTDLIASKDGLITEVLVLSGEAMVSPGDMVAEGEVLIRGIIRPNIIFEEDDSEQETTEEQIRAHGIVEARVWYEGYGEAMLYEVNKERTGRWCSAYTLNIKDVIIPLWNRISHDFRNYEMERVKRRWHWRNIYFPVELTTVHIYEVNYAQHQVSRSKALEIAKERALKQAWSQVPSDAEVIEWYEEEIDPGAKNSMARRVIIEVQENIAIPRERGNYLNNYEEDD